MKEHKLFFGGIPTKPDVDALVEKFGVPDAGVLISYEGIQEIIKVPKDSNRFKGVVTSWRKFLFKTHNVLLECEAGAGFRAMSDKDRVNYAVGKTNSGVKAITSALLVIERTPTDGLDDENKRIHQHLRMTNSQLRLVHHTAAREFKLQQLDSGNGKTQSASAD